MKVYASTLALLASRYSTNFLYFVSLSMITRIELYSTPVNRSLESRSLTMKSKAINFYTSFGTSVNMSCLYGKCLLDFDLLQMSHSLTTVSTYFLIPRK